MYTADGFQPVYYDNMVPPPGMMMMEGGPIKPDPDELPLPKVPKKRGPKKKRVKQEEITEHFQAKKRKRDRFNGMTEDEVMKKELPDHLQDNLDIVIVGINPGLCAAYVGHHYAGPGNHFWKCMFLSGLIPEPLNAYDDYKLTKYGIGFTNIVARTTRGSSDLTRKEIKEGAALLLEKMKKYKPKIAVFNGKGIYEVFIGHKNFAIGKQPEKLEGTDTTVFVMPSSSARCSQLPRAVDKVPFYNALKKLRDHLRGDLETLDDSEVCFPDLELKVVKKEVKQEESEDNTYEGASKYFMSNGPMNNVPMPNGTYPNQGPCNSFMNIKQENNCNEYGSGNSYNCSSQQMPYSMNQGSGPDCFPQGQGMFENSSHVVPHEGSSQFYPGACGNTYQSQGPYPQNDFQMHQQGLSQQSHQQMMMNQHSNQSNQSFQGQGQYQSHGQPQCYQYQQYCQESCPGQSSYMSQSFTQAPGFTQAMSMQMQSQFHHQNQGSFMMSSQGEFRMSMTTHNPTHNPMGWQGQQGMIKQEPYDWSTGHNGGGGDNGCTGTAPNIGCYDNSVQGPTTGPLTQGTSPLQHLQNLSQGLNMDMVPQRPNSQQSTYSNSPRRSLTPGVNQSPMGSPLNVNGPTNQNSAALVELSCVKNEPTEFSTENACVYQGNMGT